MDVTMPGGTRFASWRPPKGTIWQSVGDFPLDGDIKRNAVDSIKNGLIAGKYWNNDRSDMSKVYVQHIKVGKDSYRLSVYKPWTPLQAFAFGLVMHDGSLV